MGHIEMLKLGTDVALVLSVLYLCFRFAGASSGKSVDLGKVQQLDSALRELMKEADGAGRALNQQLLKRQSELERLLNEAEGAETRLNRSIEQIESRVAEIESSVGSSARREDHSVAERVQEAPVAARSNTIEPPSFQTSAAAQTMRSFGARVEEQASFGRTNIYGEPVSTEASSAPATPRPMTAAERRRSVAERSEGLAQSVEKQVMPNVPYGASVQQSVQSIYASAEEMLKTGRDLEYVAAKTKIPMEEVKLLAHMIEQEKSSRVAAPVKETMTDPRLGVLGSGMKRQRMTV